MKIRQISLKYKIPVRKVMRWLEENKSYGLNVLVAGLECRIDIDNIANLYYGQYESDIAFAKKYAESMEGIKETLWPNRCIDWEKAAKELMQGFVEDNGHYFCYSEVVCMRS